MFMLGYAWQKGRVPVSEAAILRAIELNGVAVEANKEAFLWGRRAAHDLDAVRRIARPEARKGPDVAATLDEAVERRIRFLEGYQGRSEEHMSELQSLMRISYAVFCLKKKNKLKLHITMYQYTHIIIIIS